MIDEPTLAALGRIADAQPHPLVFATVSGAHLYGFPSADSDFDLRGVHVLPLDQVIGLDEPTQTMEAMGDDAGLDMDLVTHDLKKFLKLLLRPNGYVLEQLTSPLIVRTSDTHRDLLDLAPKLITRHHARHYLGFAASQRRLFEKQPSVKAMLYTYRVLLTGLHLMRTGEVQADLRQLSPEKQPGLPELMRAKAEGAEKQPAPADVAHHVEAWGRLEAELKEAAGVSALPERVPVEVTAACDDLLRRVRLATRTGGTWCRGYCEHD
jgi:predicted nucleotidyltransferase